jgi:2-desacetyl-2-hydroxyethyl bacteriochlorophyllide A dehydrogenase
MEARSLRFTGPREVAVRRREVPPPGDGEVLVATELSAVSPGTELLVYRDDHHEEMELGAGLPGVDGGTDYPIAYGYAAVGEVVEAGAGAEEWVGRRVFAFHPHESHFLAEPDRLVPVDGLPPATATLVANAEAAVNFVMDARPRVGARTAVFGQGVVGLLTTAVLGAHPLGRLVVVDRYERRRELARSLGADAAVAPDADVAGELADEHTDGADVVFELSGNPAALDAAVDVVGYAGQVVVGSWYGRKTAELDLGGEFHRGHARIRASQVSQVDPDHLGRWDKARRFDLVTDLLATLPVGDVVTHRVPLSEAARGYELLDRRPGEAVGVAFTYD